MTAMPAELPAKPPAAPAVIFAASMPAVYLGRAEAARTLARAFTPTHGCYSDSKAGCQAPEGREPCASDGSLSDGLWQQLR